MFFLIWHKYTLAFRYYCLRLANLLPCHASVVFSALYSVSTWVCLTSFFLSCVLYLLIAIYIFWSNLYDYVYTQSFWMHQDMIETLFFRCDLTFHFVADFTMNNHFPFEFIRTQTDSLFIRLVFFLSFSLVSHFATTSCWCCCFYYQHTISHTWARVINSILKL